MNKVSKAIVVMHANENISRNECMAAFGRSDLATYYLAGESTYDQYEGYESVAGQHFL